MEKPVVVKARLFAALSVAPIEQCSETRFVKGILFSKIQFQNHYMNESVLFRV